MAPEQSVIFAPEMDERQLDREVSQVDEQLQEVGQGVPVDFDEQGGMDGLGMPEGGLDGFGGDGGGGIGGGAAGAGALASRIPKPIAGVSAASVMPVALAGGVGLGMLSAMQGASARLQTSNKMLSTAWNNIWRAPGDLLDKELVRPLAEEILGMSVEFEDQFRRDPVGAVGGLASNLLSGNTGNLINAIMPATIGPRLFNEAITGNIDIGGIQSTIEGIQPALEGGIDTIQTTASDIVSEFNNIDWGNVLTDLQDMFTGGIDLGQWMFSGAIDFGQWMFHGAIDLGQWMFHGAIGLGQWLFDEATSISWSDIQWAGSIGWDAISWVGAIGWDAITWAGSIGWDFIEWTGSIGWDFIEWTGAIELGRWMFEGAINPNLLLQDDPKDEGASIVPVGGFGPGVRFPGVPTAQSGGRVSRTGVAEVHRGELIADPDRLVDDLASAIGDAGGGGATTDTTAIEDKLDRLHSDMKRLERALDVTLQVGREEIARASAEGKTHDLADSDPTV